jgi:hypothetical protein
MEVFTKPMVKWYGETALHFAVHSAKNQSHYKNPVEQTMTINKNYTQKHYNATETTSRIPKNCSV